MTEKDVKRSRKPAVNSGWKPYLEKTKDKLTQENPNLSKLEIYSIASDMWQKEPESQKRIYSRMEKRHNKRKKDSTSSDSDKIFENEKVKRHISAYGVFVNEKQTELRDSRPDLTLLERKNIIDNLWKQLDHAEKNVYVNKAKCINRRIDKDSTDSDEEKCIITRKEKEKEKEKDKEKITFDEYMDDAE